MRRGPTLPGQASQTVSPQRAGAATPCACAVLPAARAEVHDSTPRAGRWTPGCNDGPSRSVIDDDAEVAVVVLDVVVVHAEEEPAGAPHANRSGVGANEEQVGR